MKKTLLLSALVLITTITAAQSITRIEPENWWVGMKHHTIALLVYGKNISELTPKLAYTGVKLVKLESTENPNYLFLTLNIEPTAKPGKVKIDFTQNGKTLISKDFPLLEREAGSANRASFSQKDAIYLIVPDRFANGDPSNDALPAMLEKVCDRAKEGGRHGGDIQGISNHLDYLQSLGYTQIWCTPLLENDEPAYSYHGYAATDFYKIDPRFGTNEQFKALVQAAKKRGMGFIWDVVLNHCGSEYYFVKDLPSKDWINFSDTHTRCNHLKSTLYDIYATEIDKEEYSGGWFDHHMADLNQRNPLVAQYLLQNTIWWIEYAGIAGFREDTYSYSDREFLARWSKAILDEYPNFNIVAEEMTRVAAQNAYWQKDKKNFDGYQSYLPTMMDFPLNDQLVSSLNRTDNWASPWRDTYQSIAGDYQFAHPDDQLIFPDNHDLDRFYTRVREDFGHWKLGMALYATMRGIPQFFYGTEVLMTNEKIGDDGFRRGDFYGGWPTDAKNALTGAGLTAQEKEAQAYLSKLLNWRKTSKVVAEGKFMHFAPQKNDVYVYFRYTDTEKLMVLLNKNTENVTLDLTRYAQMIPSSFSAIDVVTGKRVDANGALVVAVKTAMILEIK